MRKSARVFALTNHGLGLPLVRLVLAGLLVITVICATSASFGANDEPVIRVGVSSDFRPYAFADKDGRPVGYSIDLIEAVARAMGLRVQIKAGTWDEVWHGLTQGQIDVLAIVAKTPDWESQVDFSVPHTETFDAFFVRAGQPAIPNLAAAAGKDIVVRRSDVALKMLPRNFSGKLTLVDTIPQGLALVATGQHDAFLTSKLIGTLEMREYHIRGLTAGPPIPDYKRVFAFAVRKGNTELLEKLNQGLRIIKANGEYDRIYQQWLQVHPENRWQRWIPYFQWTLAGFAVLAALTGFLQWLVRLRTRQLALANEKISAEVAERRKAEAALQQLNATLEQRIAERTVELQQAREWLRVTLSSIGDAVLATDIAGRITFMNPVAAALTGWRPEEAEGQLIQNVFRIINEQTRVTAEDIVVRVLKEGHVIELANHTGLVTKDGREIPIEDSAAPIEDRSGDVIGVVLVFHDVTEKRRSQEALQESRAKLHAALESMTDAVFISDAEGRFHDFNEAFATFHKFRSKAECAKTLAEYPAFLDIFLPDGQLVPFEMWTVSRALRGEAVTNAEYVLRRKDTGETWVGSFSFGPIRNKEGEIVGSVVVGRDITERKRAEQALVRSEKLASVGRMAASIAHEINNPLSAVTNTLYLAKSSLAEPELAQVYLNMAEDELKRISHITRQTLGFYRESSAPTLVSINEIVDSALDLLVGKIKLKRTQVDRQYDGDLKVTAVAGELRQVFSNLVANSLDATALGGTIKVRLSRVTCVTTGQARVRVTVADDGSGINAATLPHLFEPLFTTKEQTGSGLGLWVSKELIDKHKGFIQVRSSTRGKRRGSTFSVVIPVNSQPAAKGKAAGTD